MRIIKKSFLKRVVAVSLLIVIAESTVHPTITYALTTGPHQPEYTSYEEPGSTDMVNLLTGDFTYSLPVLDVPSPDGKFSIPLTYNAGIGPEQEASWVGLGWTLNVGAITREINQYPDDASGEVQNITNVNLVGVRGWTSAALGLGQIGWNTAQGSYGAISLLSIVNVTYDNRGISSGGLIGLNVGRGKFSFDATQFAMAAVTIATMGSGSVAEFGIDVAKQLAVGAAMSLAFSSQTPGLGPAAGYWSYNHEKVKQGFLHKDYWIWLDQTRNEQMYGSLNLDQVPASPFVLPSSYYLRSGVYPNYLYYNPQTIDNATITGTSTYSGLQAYMFDGNITGAASDINFYVPPKVTYRDAKSASLMAVDNFTVKAPGIYGVINPYRLDVGSVSMPRAMTGDHVRYSILPFVSYKVPFTYNGLLSSSYLYQTGNSTPNFNFGLNCQYTNVESLYNYSGTPRPDTNYPYVALSNYNFTLTDNIFDNGPNGAIGSRVRSDVANNSFKIPQANHIEWLKNSEIANVAGSFSNGFMDYFTTTSSPTRNSFRSNYTFNNNAAKKPNSIGGYSITGPSGLTYHFALPSYDYQYYTWIGDKTNPSSIHTTINRNDPFANTWLLTGITGPDFIDRNSNGAIDTGDWGYWVKFNYGKWSDSYYWQIPYNIQNPSIDPTNSSLTYSNGYKQLYYLNSIETRSHVAVFLKDLRNDNRDANGISISSLQLSEIALFTRQEYSQWCSTYGLANDSGSIGPVWINSDLYTPNPAIGNFVIQNAIKRVKFTYDYSLCQGTPNSAGVYTDANNVQHTGGKLTLNRVSIIGSSSVQVLPDYKFAYGNNPTYDPNKWDGWGMYNSNGTSAYNTHAGSSTDSDGASWSLSQITTPQGSTVNINYERDVYSSISGMAPPSISYGVASSGYYFVPSLGTTLLTIPNYNGGLYPGDAVSLNGTMSYSCNGSMVNGTISGNYTIQSIQSNNITFSSAFGTNGNCSNSGPTAITLSVTLKTVTREIKGGGTRVGSITLNDQNNIYKSRYLYVDNNGVSTGVVSQEAPYAQTSSFDFNKIPGYPTTPIMYSMVSVLSGSLSTDADYNTKQVYQFETPSVSLISVNSDTIQFFGPIPNTTDSLASLKHNISDYTSKIGSLKSTTTYDAFNNVISSVNMSYTNQPLNTGGANNYQGYFASGTLMHERLGMEEGSTMIKMNRSTVIKYPYTLQSIVTQKDGFSTETDNISWDFISGQVVEKNDRSPLGIRTKTITQPAYSITSNSIPVYSSGAAPVYPMMGPIAFNSSNKNMLTQPGAEYVYRLDALGNITGLISGHVTTWNGTWNNYRDFNASSNTYSQNTGTPNVMRKSQSYVYKGAVSDVQPDGSLKFNTSNSIFDFTMSTGNPNWLQTSAVTLYDHYSLPVQTLNPITGISSSVKRDFNNMYVLATASNATYFEFAYSGAEDWTSPNLFFGGEVALNSPGVSLASVVTSSSHTGKAAVQVPAGANSFVYDPVSLTPNRTYRAQVWTNSMNGAIYYKNGTSSPTTVLPLSVNKVGNWYKILADITVPSTFSSFEVGVTSVSGTVLFDDFRFQPRDGGLQTNVFDMSTGYLTYTLGNDNLYTRYQYDNRGILMKTYVESIKYNGERLVSQQKDNYKRNNTNQ